jgi:hypothetical protein
MGIIRQRQQTDGARSRAKSSKQNNQQATRCPGGLPKTPKAAVTKSTAYAFRKAISMSGSWYKTDVGVGDIQPREVVEVINIAGRKFDANFWLIPLYGDGNPLSRPQDVPNSKDAITVYYRHRLAGNNVTGEMKIQSSGTIAQLKHATPTFKEYLLKDRVHINNATLGPEEAVVLGWIPGSHPVFSFRYNMCEAIQNQIPIEYANVEWALFPKTIYYTRA